MKASKIPSMDLFPVRSEFWLWSLNAKARSKVCLPAAQGSILLMASETYEGKTIIGHFRGNVEECAQGSTDIPTCLHLGLESHLTVKTTRFIPVYV